MKKASNQLSTVNQVFFRLAVERAKDTELTPILSVSFQLRTKPLPSFATKGSVLFLSFVKLLQRIICTLSYLWLLTSNNLVLVSVENVIRGHYLLLNRWFQMPLPSLYRHPESPIQFVPANHTLGDGSFFFS